MYLIIVGAGNIGAPLIDIATRSGNEVVVIERNRERAENAADQFDCLVLNDDATVKDTLEDAGIDRAHAIISTTDQDATNIMVCLLASEFDVPNVVSVVHDHDHMNLFERIGAHTMQNPQRLIAENLYRAVERPTIVDYMHVGETAEVFEIRVGEDAPIAGKTLTDAASEGIIADDMLIVAIERNGDGNGNPITPRGDSHIEPGDSVTVYSERGAIPKVTDIFGRFEDHEMVSNEKK
jgi:trk system potassium uptake protein TrkA